MTQQFLNDSIFWVELEKVKPNPFQPRREFDEARLRELADSIRMYGVLQPLVVTRKEIQKEDGGGLATEYELISGERRLRASRLVGLAQVPVIIRFGAESDREKLELAIIENLQREDLNVVDRARAFKRLSQEFGFKHFEIGAKVGKSREYVSNSLRVLDLPDEMIQALSLGKISEGHTRPLLMLTSRPEEQVTLFKEIVYKRVTVREAESAARRIAVERARRKDLIIDSELVALEEKLRESLGTRVRIERLEKGGRIHIDFFSHDDVRAILALVEAQKRGVVSAVPAPKATAPPSPVSSGDSKIPETSEERVTPTVTVLTAVAEPAVSSAPSVQESTVLLDDRSAQEKQKEENEEMYSVKNFSI
jgi:ParB family chromosome partitioning protein